MIFITLGDGSMSLFLEFHRGSLPLYSLNFETIILLPKSEEALKIQQTYLAPQCELQDIYKSFD
jgi:hypothetical protein